MLALLQGSQALQAAIHDDSQLPPVARSLHQIEAETRALSAGAQQAAAPDAQMYRFLATQGIDPGGLDPNALELTTSSWEEAGMDADTDCWDGNVDRLLEKEQQQIFLQARRGTLPSGGEEGVHSIVSSRWTCNSGERVTLALLASHVFSPFVPAGS